MRYEIKNGQVVESIFIDAPYDTREDAERHVDCGVKHNCQYCTLGECRTQDALQQYNAKRRLQGKIVGE